MKRKLQKINHFLFHLTLWPMLLLFPLGVLDQLLGAGFLIRMFASLGFPKGYDWLVRMNIALCAVFLVTVLLKVKVFKE